MRNAECVYCNEVKPVKVWSATGEEVCYDCRHDLLDQEFTDAEKVERMIQ